MNFGLKSINYLTYTFYDQDNDNNYGNSRRAAQYNNSDNECNVAVVSVGNIYGCSSVERYRVHG